ncbi:hypothetical protein GpartN1_g5994.t1 [Galdieria partita]|uniref:riboflavin kinase n=1 Tax=Galdieria partita TaxID=83374 RepID=A0A9C7Q0C3_9RHOD|nr:hypothetical protein GpartN1_g5994.t1 [Galdieria partita]
MLLRYTSELVGKQGSGPFQRRVSEPPVFLYQRDQTNPILLEGTVLRGYQRGRQLLGCPTANLSVEPYQQLLQSLDCGIYFGWASLQKKLPVYRTVVSVGWNPVFENDQKTIEAHLMADLEDFYGQHLSLLLLGFIRREFKFPSVPALEAAIAEDKWVAEKALELEDCIVCKSEWESTLG